MTDSTEQAYYENEDFWRPEAFNSDDSDRMDFLVSRVPGGIERLVDVGCGNGLFLGQLINQRPDIKELCGAERSKTALRYVKTNKFEASIDDLPFTDRSFDCVTSFEVIEHLPVYIYDKALYELSRISSRYILISVPSEQNLSIGQIQCVSCKTLFNPDYHFRSFNRNILDSLFNNFGFKVRTIENFGFNEQFRMERLLMQLKRDRSNRFTQSVPCPVCGLVLPGRHATSATDGSGNIFQSRHGIKQVIKSLWPKKKTSRWLLAVYERVEERLP